MELITDYRISITGGFLSYKTDKGRWLEFELMNQKGMDGLSKLMLGCGIKEMAFAHQLVGMRFESALFPDTK